MAPTRQKKRKSTESASSVDIQNFPAPPQMIPTKARSPTKTPTTRSPIKRKKMGITAAQKQALIDNIQLEITERARKLRAQYNLQAQGLRTRIEIRVNRIPMALRKANMGELLAKYSQAVPKSAAAGSSKERLNSPSKNLIQAGQSARASPSPQRPQKRLSDAISEDKENEDIDNPKKRVRQAPNPPTRTTSRKAPPSQVLSPRSPNSRSLARSPVRPAIGSPQKSYLARPVSPLKPSAPASAGGPAGILTNMVEKAKSARGAATRKAAETSAATGVGRGKRNAAPTPAPRVGRGRASGVSESSESSNTTTIVRKPVAVPKKEPAKKTVMGTIRGMGTKKAAPVAKAAAPPAATTGGRVLRKRA